MTTGNSSGLHTGWWSLAPAFAAGSPSARGKRAVAWLWRFLLAVWIGAGPGLALAKDRAEYAREIKADLVQRILPYWYDTAIDHQYGGYLLSDDAARKAPPATEKQLVTQARMVWGFSHAHLKGLEDGKRDYLKAAEPGYRFLLEHFRDAQYGGYYWTTDRAGKPLDDRKLVYGEAFVIYAFVEYYRASHDAEALRQARELYQVLQAHAHDTNHQGWVEHFQRDWTPILDPHAQAVVELAGRKSANTHLHLMEALTELYDATRDPDVRASLIEAVRINCTWFYPAEVSQSMLHRLPDGSPTKDPASAEISYGHNVEFAWLMLRAQRVLGQVLAWPHFDAHLQYALKYGYDHEHGGLYSRGVRDEPASDTDKIWWVQAEMLAALTDALQHKEDPACSQALEQLLEFVRTYQADPKDGVWLDTVTADGHPKNTGKAHAWKGNYHDVRALVKFVEAFGK